MSNETLKPVRTIRLLTIIAGIVLMLGGATTWFVVTDQLKAANITVAEDADYFADTPAGGKTYAELDREDPARVTAMNASFLRASLFTSVVSYGVALFAAGMGLLSVLIGWSLRRVAA